MSLNCELGKPGLHFIDVRSGTSVQSCEILALLDNGSCIPHASHRGRTSLLISTSWRGCLKAKCHLKLKEVAHPLKGEVMVVATSTAHIMGPRVYPTEPRGPDTPTTVRSKVRPLRHSLVHGPPNRDSAPRRLA